MVKIDLKKEIRVCQGDILKNVELIEYAIEKDGNIEISKIIFPLTIVLTQDCDLQQDFTNRNKDNPTNQDKHLISIIVAPIYNLEHVYAGEHLSELGLQMQLFSNKPEKLDNKFLKQNQNPRYHYLEFDKSIQIVDSVIDFKHYFTVNVRYLDKHKVDSFVGKVSELFRENISHRFASFLSRIGLPEEK
jgi:hypothetical protein